MNQYVERIHPQEAGRHNRIADECLKHQTRGTDGKSRKHHTAQTRQPERQRKRPEFRIHKSTEVQPGARQSEQTENSQPETKSPVHKALSFFCSPNKPRTAAPFHALRPNFRR